MQLYVLRHGQTDLNIDQRYLGALDPALNAHGIAQAHAVAAKLPLRDATIVTSPLLRARQTAAILSAATGSDLFVVPAFRERHVGVFEGLTQADAQQRFPHLWKKNSTRIWNDAPTGGETIEQVFIRVHHGLTQLRQTHADARVVLVAHGFVAKVVHALLTACTASQFFAYALQNSEWAHYAIAQDAKLHLRPPPSITQI